MHNQLAILITLAYDNTLFVRHSSNRAKEKAPVRGWFVIGFYLSKP